MGSAVNSSDVDSGTRDQLIQRALELFEQNGYPRTSVEDIVDAAGLTKGAFYHHFQSKEEVLEIIHNDYVDAQVEMCERIIGQFTDPREQFAQIARSTIIGLGEYRAHVSVYLQDRRFLTGERRDNVTTKRNQVDRIFTGIIERGAASGVFRKDVDPKLVAFGLIGMYAWVINWWRPGGPLTLQEVADQYVELILGGLLTPST
ncbi:MAG: TetR family transcriptional regulator [Ilumatobacteraceae bacterium]|jgi:AcrR family transcriptional regulator